MAEATVTTGVDRPVAIPKAGQVRTTRAKAARDRGPVKRILVGLFRFFSSFGLVVVLLGFLLLLTYLGTEEQPKDGLFEVQKKYFESSFLVHRFWGTIPVILPGVYLLLVLLFINLLLGGIIRIRKTWRTPGVIVAHFAILFLLLGGFVQHKMANDGYITLYENQSSNTFTSYYDWIVEIRETSESGDGDEFREALIIPETDVKTIKAGANRVFTSDKLPFSLTLSDYVVNARPLPAAYRKSVEPPVSDGWFLRVAEKETTAERNIAGVYIKAGSDESPSIAEGILWGGSSHPLTIRHQNRTWLVTMKRRQWKMPFTIVLDKFTKEEHPGTQVARVFKSDVTKLEDNTEEKVRIEMNKPLRHKGYTIFQANWGPEGAQPGDPLFSGFAVVDNPADQWPLWSLIVAMAGLLFHFGQKLVLHLLQASKKRKAAAPAAAATPA